MKWYNNLEDHQTSWLSASYTKEKERYINYKEFVDIVLQAHIYVSNLFLSRSFRIDRPRQCYVFIPELALCEDFLKQFFTHRFLLITTLWFCIWLCSPAPAVLPSLWVTLGRWWHTCLLSALLPVLPVTLIEHKYALPKVKFPPSWIHGSPAVYGSKRWARQRHTNKSTKTRFAFEICMHVCRDASRPIYKPANRLNFLWVPREPTKKI